MTVRGHEAFRDWRSGSADEVLRGCDQQSCAGAAHRENDRAAPSPDAHQGNHTEKDNWSNDPPAPELRDDSREVGEKRRSMPDQEVDDPRIAANDGIAFAYRIRDLDDHAERDQRNARCDQR
jgi:hypothetical protein